MPLTWGCLGLTLKSTSSKLKHGSFSHITNSFHLSKIDSRQQYGGRFAWCIYRAYIVLTPQTGLRMVIPQVQKALNHPALTSWLWKKEEGRFGWRTAWIVS